MRWATTTDENIIYGNGRAVRAIRRINADTRSIYARVAETYKGSTYLQNHIPQEIFTSGMLSALLTRDTYPAAPQRLSAAALMEIFAHGDAGHTALAVYNATLTSPLAFDDGGTPRATEQIIAELGLLWKRGRLLRYPQDRAALATLAVQQELPGVVLSLIGQTRPVISTFSREKRLEDAYQRGGNT